MNIKEWNIVKAALQLLVLLILFMAILHLLVAAIEQETKDELTQGQKKEVISRQYTAFEIEEHIDMTDRILDARVEKAWSKSR